MSTFLSLQQELATRLDMDQTNSTDATKLKRWLNMAQNYVCGKRPWPFMLAEEIIQTVVDVTTGTVAVAAGGTTLTFTSGPTASVANRYIQLSTSSDWYQITAHTAASTSATISPAYVGTTNLTAGTFKIRKLLYTTTTPLIQIIDMKQMVTPVRLVSQSPLGTDYFLSLYYDAGKPYYYVISSPNSAGNLQFSFILSPDSVLNVMIRGMKALSDLSADADLSIIPPVYHDALVHVGAFYGFQALDDTRSAGELQVAESRIADMARTYTHDMGRHRVMNSIDTDSNFGLQWALPSEFGPPV